MFLSLRRPTLLLRVLAAVLSLALLSTTVNSAPALLDEQLANDAKTMLRSDPKEHRGLGLLNLGLNFLLGRQSDADCTPAPAPADDCGPTTPSPSSTPTLAPSTSPTPVPITWTLGTAGLSCNQVCAAGTDGACNADAMNAVDSSAKALYVGSLISSTVCSGGVEVGQDGEGPFSYIGSVGAAPICCYRIGNSDCAQGVGNLEKFCCCGATSGCPTVAS